MQEQLFQLAEWTTTQAVLSKYANAFPGWLVDATSSPVESYLATDPFVTGLVVASVLSLVCWLLNIVTGNYGQVDRLWSLLPAVYAWHFNLHDFANNKTVSEHRIYGFHPRLLIISVLTTLWSVRLTYNFWRKGGYKWSHEDYRWPYLRAHMPTWAFQLLNITFIAPVQNYILFLITAPAYIVYLTRHISPPINVMDGFVSVAFLCFLVVEAISDNQQWRFQNEKYRLIKEGLPLEGDYARGFLTQVGVWRFSRHPNFFAEIAMWWTIYFFSESTTAADWEGYQGAWKNWSMTGAVLLTALFAGSTTLTEHITAEKYPAYKDYQDCVSAIIPCAPSKLPRMEETKKDK